jgi:hypothetical protein
VYGNILNLCFHIGRQNPTDECGGRFSPFYQCLHLNNMAKAETAVGRYEAVIEAAPLHAIRIL